MSLQVRPGPWRRWLGVCQCARAAGQAQHSESVGTGRPGTPVFRVKAFDDAVQPKNHWHTPYTCPGSPGQLLKKMCNSLPRSDDFFSMNLKYFRVLHVFLPVTGSCGPGPLRSDSDNLNLTNGPIISNLKPDSEFRRVTVCTSTCSRP